MNFFKAITESFIQLKIKVITFYPIIINLSSKIINIHKNITTTINNSDDNNNNK